MSAVNHSLNMQNFNAVLSEITVFSLNTGQDYISSTAFQALHSSWLGVGDQSSAEKKRKTLVSLSP